jgi:hypothetical protein
MQKVTSSLRAQQSRHHYTPTITSSLRAQQGLPGGMMRHSSGLTVGDHLPLTSDVWLWLRVGLFINK